MFKKQMEGKPSYQKIASFILRRNTRGAEVQFRMEDQRLFTASSVVEAIHSGFEISGSAFKTTEIHPDWGREIPVNHINFTIKVPSGEMRIYGKLFNPKKKNANTPGWFGPVFYSIRGADSIATSCHDFFNFSAWFEKSDDGETYASCSLSREIRDGAKLFEHPVLNEIIERNAAKKAAPPVALPSTPERIFEQQIDQLPQSGKAYAW